MSIAYNTNDKPLLFCHRGIHRDAPENSIPAFKKVLELGFNAVETDLQVCKSGEIIVIHDHNLKRLTGVDKEVKQLTLSQIKELDLGFNSSSEFKETRIPTLKELFELCGNNILYDLELKSSTANNSLICKKTWELIQEFKLEFNCIISSFNPFALKEFDKISHFALRTCLIFEDGKKVPKSFRNGWASHLCNCTILKPCYNQINYDLLDKLKNSNFKIIPWCVNTITDAKQLMVLDPIGIITDNPEILIKSDLFY